MHFSKIAVASTAFAGVNAGPHAKGRAQSSSVALSNSTEPIATWVTETVTAYTTYCPSATSFVLGTNTYTATASEWVTVTDCPKLCTISYESTASPTIIPAVPTSAPYSNSTHAAPTSAYGTGVYHAPASTIVVQPSVCPCATKSIAPGITYAGPAGTGQPGVPVPSSVNCPCASANGSPAPTTYPAGVFTPGANTIVPAGGANPSVPSNNKGNIVVSSEGSEATGSVNGAVSTGASSSRTPSTVSASGAGKLASSSALVVAVGAAVFFFC